LLKGSQHSTVVCFLVASGQKTSIVYEAC